MTKVMLAGLPIDLHAGAVQQEYSPVNGFADIRLSGGALVRQSHWSKTAISLSGVGWMGHGLDAVDYTQPQELRCTKPLSATSTSNVISITGTPRPDASPAGFALVNGRWVATAVSISDGVATLTAVPNASQYRVTWQPVFIVLAMPPAEALDPSAAEYSWQFTCQEI